MESLARTYIYQKLVRSVDELKQCLIKHGKNDEFAITVYGQCCRRHVVGQRVVSDISVVRVVVEVFVACVLNLVILIYYYAW